MGLEHKISDCLQQEFGASRTRRARVCVGLTHENAVVALLDLHDGVRIVVGRDWDVTCLCDQLCISPDRIGSITAINDLRPAVERIRGQWHL